MNPDSRFLEALRNSFNQIIRAPKEIPYSEMRALSAKQVQKAFSSVRVEIKGSENLPSEQGVIFIYNHLRNHPFFTVAEDFQITLDSHFISSSILENTTKIQGLEWFAIRCQMKKITETITISLDTSVSMQTTLFQKSLLKKR